MSTIISLDLSLAGTGIAKFKTNQTNGTGFSVTWDVIGTPAHAKNVRETPDHLWQCERNGKILNFIKKWCEGEKPDLVVIEDVFMGGGGGKRKKGGESGGEGSSFGGGSSALPLSQLAGLVRYWLYCGQKIPFVLVVGASTKKFAGLPKSVPGQARPKGLICKYVHSSFGRNTDNDNCADAIAMVYMGAGLLGLWTPDNARQQEVLDALLKKSLWLSDLRASAMKPAVMA